MLALRLLPLIPCIKGMHHNELTLNEADKLNTYSLIATGGDAVTVVHALFGAWLAGHIVASEEPNTLELGVHTLASISDMVDGPIKRMCYLAATKIISRACGMKAPTSIEKITDTQWDVMEKFGIIDRPGLDHGVDKGYMYAVGTAVTAREYMLGHTISAGLLALNLATIVPRDVLRTRQKNEIKQLGGDNHASRLGKYKTLVQNVGIGVFLSPIERYRAGRALGIGILTVSTAMGINDYRRNRSNVRYARLHPKSTQQD